MALTTEDQRETYSWRRTSALAAAMAVHGLAFIMMIAPVAPPQAKEKKKETIVSVSYTHLTLPTTERV